MSFSGGIAGSWLLAVEMYTRKLLHPAVACTAAALKNTAYIQVAIKVNVFFLFKYFFL